MSPVEPKAPGQWLVYILRCADGTLYTGITNDFEKRLGDHNAGAGAKYTRGRVPVHPVYQESCASRSEASRRERAIKKLSRADKLLLGLETSKSDNKDYE